jgi:hypothetical protein
MHATKRDARTMGGTLLGVGEVEPWLVVPVPPDGVVDPLDGPDGAVVPPPEGAVALALGAPVECVLVEEPPHAASPPAAIIASAALIARARSLPLHCLIFKAPLDPRSDGALGDASPRMAASHHSRPRQ